MNKRTFIAAAAVGGFLAAGACAKKNDTAADSTGSAVMTDTAAASAGAVSGTNGTASPTMSDTAASATGSMGSGMQDTAKGRSSGDTTTKK